jgi:hypothetical protein
VCGQAGKNFRFVFPGLPLSDKIKKFQKYAKRFCMLHELIALLVLTGSFLVGCGSAKDGNGGKDAKSPVCYVEERADKNFLVCLNADGTKVEAEIKKGENGETVIGPVGPSGSEGKPGRDAVVSSSICKGQVAGSQVSYDVLTFSSGMSLAVFKADYVSSGNLEFTDSVSTVVVDAKNPVESKLWKAELVSPVSAKITRKNPLQTASVTCKVQ